ncbi:MAG: septation ring formation regulator EzrA [Bacilli bacterium]|jgi:septation ring formation regulator EzrA|nr:septation ring formation regulator EzrA [Bacilli bacterium]
MIHPVIFLSTGYIVLIVICSIVGIAALILLYFTVFTHARTRRQARDLCGKFEREHALLFGQDSQYIKRLETISSMNLVYVQQYMDWNKRFKDVRDVSDASAQAAVNQIKDLLSERRYKDLKSYLPSAKRTIDGYEGQVDALSDSLKNKFRDEEECRTLSLEQKENYRQVKQDYYSKQNDLSLVISTFDVLFKKLDSYFDEAEQDIENARYGDGKSILVDKITPVVKETGTILKDLPNVCLLISSVIPDKLSSLSNHYEEMVASGYPLHHILLKGDMESMNQELAALSGKVKNLELAGVSDKLDEMQKQIDGYLDAFEKEKQARVIFEKECKGVYDKEKGLENSFINLCHALPKVRSIFLISSDDQSKIDSIQNTINKAGASKRSLDTYIHSSTKQPFSILVEKMKTLDGQSDEAAQQINDFQAHLVSLKEDSETANGALSVYYERAKEAERVVREASLESLSKRFMPLLDQLYGYIDALSADLKAAPIDVNKVIGDLNVLRSEGDETLKEIENSINDLNQAEAAILKANRYRKESPEVNSGLLQAENLFYSGNFKQATDVAVAVAKNVRHED